ncbi:hypothetical protein A5757_09700 [Mycobacterium sp. 852013-51886_SCH5428379]|uniref:hypothetical protein n=1 Tax=Mycobacterium sp. 852013-51886_SCH5428379 TaxID=1834111 RepID=UPI0007FD4048|nr:hypothetical protein [Mycobacterium sp. 852013-51886_SCH5428379]OBB60354.1 hypothetical protein A5757_09700 [Mycobacterium sp. 852013-51886_SCH5428379]
MSIVNGAVHLVTRTADATTAAAGAVGGAVVNGIAGGLQGTAAGIRDGLGKGSQSPAAAAITIGAIGAAGLVEWPLLLAVGGGALVVHQLSRRTDGEPAPPPLRPVQQSDNSARPAKRAPAKKAAPPRKSRPTRRQTTR